ncbi:efflux RND transporter periplasmic adaptor subunit [Rhodohalobacter sp.]|uniref:efflux RND transporter periplasmic adaptor subunit n=1 Tax=Rhodohalobacter sp. TaxID=1974210 RepID=UPI002ACEFB98|nr:efflux RND transporter periplasmic adaptor subunit [Rhodohalobacter sp.]MDZ7755983.1 efflux RND transporter periplasmic adaptor subunit [Rhodohalobacter sp.]
MRSIRHIPLLILLILITIGCSEREQVQVKKMNLVQGVYASGNVVPVGHYEVTSKVSGIVDEILVDVGQEVTTGTALVKLQNQPNESNLRIARNQLELARKNAASDSDILKQLRQQLENSRAVFLQDSIEVERYRQLQQDSIVTRQDFERTQLQFQTSLNNYRIAESKLREANDRLQIELDNARNNYQAQESMTGDYTILSAMDGKVYDIIPKEGELIAGNRPIMAIGATDRFETELQVDETDIVMVQEGQQVYYELDAIEDTVLSGVVTLIYPRINTIERTAKVIASIESREFPLYPGMALEANIVVNEKENVLVIPVTYISEENEVILKDGSLKRVETGIRDLNNVEIVSGLEEGQVVLKPEP